MLRSNVLISWSNGHNWTSHAGRVFKAKAIKVSDHF